MQAKKTRTHSCGQTNVDFRTLKDDINIKKFQPWKAIPDFGTMGYSDYHLKFKEYKDLMNPTKRLNTIKDKRNEMPNPKFYSTACMYNSLKVPVKQKTFYNSEKLAELDESFKGKDKFIGDSMMIAQITKTRKKNTFILSESDKKNKGKR